MLAVLAFFAWQARHFELDASADCAAARGRPRSPDPARAADALPIERFGSWSPSRPAATSSTRHPLARLRALRDRLRTAPGVESVTSILDVPPARQRRRRLAGRGGRQPPHARRPGERIRARARRRNCSASPVFAEVIVSADARTTALLLSMKDDEAYRTLLAKRNRLLVERSAEDLDDRRTRCGRRRAGRHRAVLRVRETPRDRKPGGPRSRPSGACSRSSAAAPAPARTRPGTPCTSAGCR